MSEASDATGAYIIGMIIGGIITAMLSFLLVSAYWKEQAIEHGCAEAAVEWQWKEPNEAR